MRRFCKRSLAVLLAVLILFGTCEAGVAYAVDEIDKAINPAEQIELTVPEAFADGENWFFIANADWSAGEKSGEKLYIPIQRAGDLNSEAEVTLKVIDLSAKHDVNYTVEVYKEKVTPETAIADLSMVELAQNADGQEEVQLGSENDMGQVLYEVGGADIVDGEGSVVGSISATPMDENGNPIPEPETETAADEPEAETAADEPETETAADDGESSDEASEWTEAELSGPAALLAARNVATGTISDRQPLAAPDMTEQALMAGDEFGKDMAAATEDGYPGREYTLRFKAGEDAKFLVITPLYSEAAEGDAQILLMLKNPGEGWAIGENVNPVSVTILDEDEPEPVTVSMAAETITAEDGKAVVTVTRSGRINTIKGVQLSSWGGSATEGDEYSGVGAKLYFPVGITSRTVEIPVYHGTEQKDFYVTITALEDEEIGTATTHVLIPKATADGELMGISNVNGHPYTDPINLKAGSYDKGGFNSDTSFYLRTSTDKKETVHFWLDTSVYGYAYDGIYLEYDGFQNWCNAEYRLVRWTGDNANRVHTNSINDGGWSRNHWLYSAWNAPKASEKYSIEAANVEFDGFKWNDKYCEMQVKNVRLVKRQFDINVDKAEVKPLLGVDDTYVLNNYETVFLDSGTASKRTLWTGDSFAITAQQPNGFLRLVGLEAKSTDGAWVRIASIDGSSATITVDMNADNINALSGKNLISWSTNGKCDHGGNFYKGTLTVRPVFEYQNASVELQQNSNGELYMTAPTPNLLWDFNKDNAMNSHMGSNWSHQVSYTGGKNGSDDYYTFTASGSDPYVSMDTPMSSASDVKWVKIRARNSSSTKTMQLFASVGSAGKNIGNTRFDIPIATDGAWHEYVVEITNANWKDNIQWLRLDPLDGCRSGDKIDIDYVAFFSDELSAKAFRSESEVHTEGTYTYHLGDTPYFRTVVSATGSQSNLKGDGVTYQISQRGKTGVVKDWTNSHYLSGNSKHGVTLTGAGQDIHVVVDMPYYTFKPTFTEKGNCVTVEVSKAALDYLDTSKGFFAISGVTRAEAGDSYVYTVYQNVNSNVRVSLTAVAKSGAIALWTQSNGVQSGGSTVDFFTAERSAANRVKLQVWTSGGLMSDDGDGALMDDFSFTPTYASISGTVTTSTFNLTSQRSAANSVVAPHAYVTYGDAGTWTDENGHFELPAIFTLAGLPVTYTVTYNGATSILLANVPAATAPKSTKISDAGQTVEAVTANVGAVKVDAFSEEGAHFVSAYADQIGVLYGSINALSMNGKQLTFTVNVAQGQDYDLNGTTYQEHIKDVTLYFMNQYTGEVHGMFSSSNTGQRPSGIDWSWDEDTGVFTLTIAKFSPETPENWTYGDVLMAQLTTDKKVALSAFADQDMHYDPVSTGYGVFADPDYKPQTFQFDIDNVAQMVGATPQTDGDGKLLDDDNSYSFGAFPYMGEITTAVHVFFDVASTVGVSKAAQLLRSDLSAAAGDDVSYLHEYDDDDINYWGSISAFFDIVPTQYGGMRFMVGAVYTYNGGSGYKSQRNPYSNNLSMMRDRLTDIADAYEEWKGTFQYSPGNMDFQRSKLQNNFAGPHFTFSGFIGFYLDYGYVEITNNGTQEKSHEMVYMGAGGFFGGSVSGGYTWPFVIVFVPAYINVDAGFNITFFLGSEGDPKKTLDSFYNTDELTGQDFSFNCEIYGKFYGSVTIGVGFYKVLGMRVSAGVSFELGYSNNMTEWYPQLFDSDFGYVSEATFAGTLDLIVTSIDVYKASWPLPLAGGFMYYFQEYRRATKCITYVESSISKGKGSASAQARARELIAELRAMMNAEKGVDGDDLRSKTYELKDYAYNNDIIEWTTKNTIEMNSQSGIAGMIINGVTQDDDDGSGIRYHTNGHVDSQWVAGDGQLMAAYQAVRSTPIMQDAYAQPSTKIVGIGDNRFLMVFLDDEPSRDNIMAAQLKWTIYDAANDTWTVPRAVQNDHTADGKPSLVDAGDKVILSWASPTDAKYDALKEEVAQEIKSSNDAMVQAALEDDPARVMSTFDIFTVEFDKSSRRFGSITQLTDDDFYDDYPQAIYDQETGDYIVVYYKTAQDTEAYTGGGDKLTDLVGVSADPNKTYSLLCYMLYNNQTNAEDTKGQTHAAGWARDYYFPNETAEDAAAQEKSLATWKGQRLIDTRVRNADGTFYNDPPITDLTVCAGYNGFGTYAFTVDKDFDLSTAEDRELWLQIYNFKTHSSYYAVNVAGSVTETTDQYDSTTGGYVPVTATRQVEVGAPKLIRNGGSTFLFWREDGETLKYLNVTEMMNAKVAAVANPDENKESDWTYAVQSNGTFATDAATGITYAPRAQKVDFGSALTEDAIHITDYEVMADKDDNLYVVWTDTVTNEVTNEIGETRPVTAQEIYASALIHQEAKTITGTAENGATVTDTTQTARWSKPYRLTRENAFNDGVALALDKDGGLIIVHNQYTKKTAQSEAEVMKLLDEGKIGLTQDAEGNYYAATIEYNSPVSLMVTRCDKVGSLEATQFTFSDDTPVAGETIKVKAAIENVGLTDAEGMDVTFYEYKNGKQGKQIAHTTSDDTITVNTAKEATFYWTVPTDGPAGYSIEAVIKEKKPDGSYYDSVKSYSDVFETAPAYALELTDVTQEGNQFRVDFKAANTGNADAEDGTKVELRLVGLYGDLDSDRYGNLETGVLYSKDITSELKAKTLLEKVEGIDKYALPQDTVYEGDVLVDIPASVFRYCGYDAIELVVTDANGSVVEESNQQLVRLAEPMNLKLNSGSAISLSAGGSQQVALDFDSNVFLDKGNVVYSVADPSIATVDESGNVTGLKNGTTTLTATLLPYGSAVSTTVKVGSGGTPSPSPSTPPTTDITVEVSSDEGAVSVTAKVSGNTATITAPSDAQMEEIVGKSKETGAVTIDLSSLPETVTAVSIPAETVKTISDAMKTSGEGLTIKLPNSTVTFDPEALAAIAEQTTGKELKLNVDLITEKKLNAKQKDAVADLDVQAVYDIYLTSDNKRITDFGGGKATIQVTYKVKDGQQPGGIEVWYVADEGGKTWILTTATADTVTFTLTYFSNYVLTYDETLPGACARDDDCPMTPFTDLDKSSWYHDGVHWALENSVMNGVGNNKFDPNGTTSRAMIVTMLYRMEGEPEITAENPFNDVRADTWYTDAVIWAAENEIVNGYGGGKFGPEDDLTREQLVTILQRYANYKGIDTSEGEMKPLKDFDDTRYISDWAVKAFRWAVDAGIINGTGNGKISPKTDASRAQVATMLMRYDSITQ